MLLVPFDFSGLIDHIKREAQRVQYKHEKGNTEAKGCWRPVFSFEVSEEAFDRFFNSPYGYRGQYYLSPEKGIHVNGLLVSAMTDRLLQSAAKDSQNEAEIKKSLASPHAKVWIDEKHLNLSNSGLIIELRVPEWEKAAIEASDKFKLGVASEKEINRIYGVRAPLGTTLTIKGAWICPGDSCQVVASKERRAEEIQAYGIS